MKASVLLLVTFVMFACGQLASAGDNTDLDWLFLENSHLRVGLLRSHGGAIAYLSDHESRENVFNHYDHGRLVQQSYYGDQDGSKWSSKAWRYNPVQGGSYRGRAAEITEFQSTATTAYVKTTPRHWATGELLDECAMEQWVAIEGPILKIRFQFSYQGERTHRPRHQETPAVFVSPHLSRLVRYRGDAPWTGGKLTEHVPGWPNEYHELAEGWAAYVGDDNLGVGVFVPDAKEATCYRFQATAKSACSYIAPLRTFALTPELKFAYTAYFTIGDPETIRQRFADVRHEAPIAPE